jgi:phage baseplate assembly protein W
MLPYLGSIATLVALVSGPHDNAAGCGLLPEVDHALNVYSGRCSLLKAHFDYEIAKKVFVLSKGS